jgi:putative restriction endonuclease
MIMSSDYDVTRPPHERSRLGFPVRVIRGADGDRRFSPRVGYRYDGLYAVTKHWKAPSVDGPMICRFRLEKVDGAAHFGGSLQDGSSGAPAGTDQPERAISTIMRIVRNTRVSQPGFTVVFGVSGGS